jgi:hypothetical protein
MTTSLKERASVESRRSSAALARPPETPMPASRALTIAGARSVTRSVVKMLEMWLRTVFWLRAKRRAIASLPAPGRSAPAPRARAGLVAGMPGAARLVRPRYSIRRRAIAGPKTASPEPTAGSSNGIGSVDAASELSYVRGCAEEDRIRRVSPVRAASQERLMVAGTVIARLRPQAPAGSGSTLDT